jgi:hypothetical protein
MIAKDTYISVALLFRIDLYRMSVAAEISKHTAIYSPQNWGMRHP